MTFPEWIAAQHDRRDKTGKFVRELCEQKCNIITPEKLAAHITDYHQGNRMLQHYSEAIREYLQAIGGDSSLSDSESSVIAQH